MRGWPWAVGGGVLALAVMASAAGRQGETVAITQGQAVAGGQLPTFRSQRDLDALLEAWKRKQAAERKRVDGIKALSGMPVPVAAPAPAAVAQESAAAPVAEAASGDGITNVQTAGVDEGGIVKRHGDHLVVLRRGRLFSLRVGGDALQPVSSVDAYAPGLSGSAWYDEMLISGDRVVVIGYSYARQGTEVGVFQINDAGVLRHLDTWHLRSGDYYASRNYASRLIGSTLVFYAPLPLSFWRDDMLTYPGVSHWRGPQLPQDFQRLLPATAIYRADAGLDPLRDGITLHTVTRCDLATLPIHCTATGVLGPTGREFYVARDAVYVWTQQRGGGDGVPPEATVLRLPMTGGPASALRARGTPIDQFSFLESGGTLNVLLQSDGRGGGMWGAEHGQGRMALLRVPVTAFGDNRRVAPTSAYRLLPEVPAGNRQNRYIGPWLLYAGTAWGQGGVGPQAYALRIDATGAPTYALSPPHGVERIEALGEDAVLVGSRDKDLVFSAVSLAGGVFGIRDSHVLAGTEQGERRSHGFYYRNDGARDGVIGLPVTRRGENPTGGFLGAPRGKAAVTFLRNQQLQWAPLGELAARAEARDDHCKASCVDWYGNARPFFIGQRVFALMGYELVEGRIEGDQVLERRRIDFTPGPAIVTEVRP